MVSGKRKGNKFENQVFKDIDKIVFSRKTLGSGSSAEYKGDLETEIFLLECKHYHKIDKGMIIQWWKKIVFEASSKRKIPVLVYKEDYKPIRTRTEAVINGVPVIVTLNYEHFLQLLKEGDTKDVNKGYIWGDKYATTTR